MVAEVVGERSLARVGGAEPEDQVGLAGTLDGAADALLLDLAGSLADPRRIRDDDREPLQIEMHLHAIAGRAGLVRHDRGLATGECIQQCRLAGVGRSGKHDAEARAQDLAAMAIIQVTAHCGAQRLDRGSCAGQRVGGDVRFVGEIDGRFHQCLRFDQRRAPAVIEAREIAARLAQGLAALAFGLGVDEIGEALHLGEIDLAVVEGATGELARLGHAAAGHLADGGKHGLDHSAAAVTVQLDDVLAGEALGPREPDNDAAIEGLRGARVDKGATGGDTWLRPGLARHQLEHHAPGRPGDANHCHAGAAGGARKGEDRGGVAHGVPACNHRVEALVCGVTHGRPSAAATVRREETCARRMAGPRQGQHP